MRNLLLRASVFLVCVAGSSFAYADVSPPPDSCDEYRGEKKPVGTDCKGDQGSGTCQYADWRDKVDYSKDGGLGDDTSTVRCVDSEGNIVDLTNGEEQVPGTQKPTGSSSGCTTSPVTRLAGTGGLALLVPAIVFALRRRRS